jgi:hypothetical protein
MDFFSKIKEENKKENKIINIIEDFSDDEEEEEEDLTQDLDKLTKEYEIFMNKIRIQKNKIESELRKSIQVNIPEMSKNETETNSKDISISNLEFETDLYHKSYFKKSNIIDINREETKNSKNMFDVNKLIKEKSIIKNINKQSSLAVEKKKKEINAGSGWFNMGAPKISDEIEQELNAIELRHTLIGRNKNKIVPKELDQRPKYFQFGTIIEGKNEFYSSRRKKRDRKESILEEFIHENGDEIKERFQKIEKANPKRRFNSFKKKKLN